MVGSQDRNFRPSHTIAHDTDSAYLSKVALANEGLWKISDTRNAISDNQIESGGALILPFLSEPKSALRVAEAWKNQTKVWFQNPLYHCPIFPISASLCKETEDELRGAEFPVYRQDLLLEAINWNLLVQHGVLPASALDSQNLPKGRKGKTMLAGTLLALRQNAQWIMFHDSDVTNSVEYGALEAIPRLLGSNARYEACMMALVGPNRNNEPWTTHTNIVALSEMFNRDVRKIATRLGRIIWALTGERGFSRDCILNLPFALGMGIETIFDVACCEKEVKDGRSFIQQVIGVINKEERGTSDVERENALITACTLCLARLLEYLNSDTATPLWGLDLNGAAAINACYTAKEVDIFVHPGTPAAQSVQRVRRETILPCINELEAGGYIDWKVIDHIASTR